MSNWHGYIGIENLALSAAQRGQVYAWLQSLELVPPPSQPAERNHYRIRNDNDAIVVEALFNEAWLDADVVKNQLAGIFGVSAAAIGDSLETPTFDARPSPVVTYSFGGTDTIRFAAFGGLNATWPESRIEAAAYIRANLAQWA